MCVEPVAETGKQITLFTEQQELNETVLRTTMLQGNFVP